MEDKTGNKKDPYFRDPERNKCMPGQCKFIKHKDKDTGVEWEECNRCGKKQKLNFRA